jgi:hypothetical protein
VPLVLAIETDLRQAAILKRVVRDRVHADLVVVDSRDAAVAAIDSQIPDVILVSALLSPRDEQELLAHLRALNGAEHLQTHTIPQLASTAADREPGSGKGLFGGLFGGKKDAQTTIAGCNPDRFADEITEFLGRAEQMKTENAAKLHARAKQLEFLSGGKGDAGARPDAQPGIDQWRSGESHASSAGPGSDLAETAEAAGSAWASPFEWRPAASRQAPPPRASEPPRPEPTYEPLVASQTAAPARPEPGPVVGSVLSLEDAQIHGDAPAVVEPLVYHDSAPAATPAPHAAETEEDSEALAAAPLGRHEEPAEPARAADAPLVMPRPEPVVPRVAAKTREAAPELVDVKARPRAVKRSNGRGASLRLMPLAMWARQESADAASRKQAEPHEAPRTASDELRALIAGLAVPPQIAAISYARGVRIRRVRVNGNRDHHRGDAHGSVVLSRRLLDEQRQNQ